MLDTDSKLIFEAYGQINEVGETGPSLPVDPINWSEGDIVTLEVGGMPLKFEYKKSNYSNPSSGGGDGKYYMILQPVEDYSHKYGELPNIGPTGAPQIRYTPDSPINVESDVIRRGKLNQHAHGTRILGDIEHYSRRKAQKSTAQAVGGQKAITSTGGPGGSVHPDSGKRWTTLPQWRGTARAAAADWTPFKTSPEIKSAPGKYIAGKLETGWQKLLAPQHGARPGGASSFTTNRQLGQKLANRPRPGSRMYMGAEYENQPEPMGKGASRFSRGARV